MASPRQRNPLATVNHSIFYSFSPTWAWPCRPSPPAPQTDQLDAPLQSRRWGAGLGQLCVPYGHVVSWYYAGLDSKETLSILSHLNTLRLGETRRKENKSKPNTTASHGLRWFFKPSGIYIGNIGLDFPLISISRRHVTISWSFKGRNENSFGARVLQSAFMEKWGIVTQLENNVILWLI